MNYSEIIKLLDAGYSREEILQMQTESETATEQETETATEQETETDTETEPNITESIMKEVKEMFAEMRKELTAMNILNSRQQDDHTEPEDILANIINPTTKK